MYWRENKNDYVPLIVEGWQRFLLHQSIQPRFFLQSISNRTLTNPDALTVKAILALNVLKFVFRTYLLRNNWYVWSVMVAGIMRQQSFNSKIDKECLNRETM
jgi:hypothetical protein